MKFTSHLNIVLLAAFLVEGNLSIPKLCDSVRQYSGYIDVAQSHYFFWYFDSRANPKHDPLIIWINGGPGISSLVGLNLHVGPCFIEGNSTKHNPFAWNNNANMVFLDQPVGAGFSYGPEVDNSEKAAKGLVDFLEGLFVKLPELRTKDLYIASESYGGHFVPSVGSLIKKTRKDINLKGIAIGNGLLDAKVQFKSLPQLACTLISKEACESLKKDMKVCLSLIDTCRYNNAKCTDAHTSCFATISEPLNQVNRSIFDLRDDALLDSSFMDSANEIQEYYNDESTQTKLGITPMDYQYNNNTMFSSFEKSGDILASFTPQLEYLISTGTRVLLYAGDSDYICNWAGLKDVASSLVWPGQQGFLLTQELPWINLTSNQLLGTIQSHSLLTMVKIKDAEHLAHIDQPHVVQKMIHSWINQRLTLQSESNSHPISLFNQILKSIENWWSFSSKLIE